MRHDSSVALSSCCQEAKSYKLLGMSVIAPTVKLNNGREMPVLGLGTWMLNRDEGCDLIKAAIDAGYRHFDTALLYHSEKCIGEAIREKIADGTVKREELFITSKLWSTYAHPGLVVKGCKKTLKNLGLDYVDLYLIHWPVAFKATDKADEPMEEHFNNIEILFKMPEYFPRDNAGNLIFSDADYVVTWKEMEKCVQLGLAKSIGVSNFNSKQIDRLLKSATIKPVTNQVEVHPYLNQKKLIQFCNERDITITSYGPLCGVRPLKTPGMTILFENPVILKLAQKKNKTPAQIVLRYVLQLGTIVIPKTGNKKRLLENISIFDFKLSEDEMLEMDSLNCNERVYVIPGTENHIHFPFKEEF